MQGDFSRIRRQDAFFKAVVARASSEDSNPFKLNSLLTAAQKNNNVSIDQTWSGSALLSLAQQFHGVTGKDLVTETIPEEEAVVNGEDVLYAAQPYTSDMIRGFLEQGAAPPHPAAKAPATSTHSTSAPPTTTTIPPEHRDQHRARAVEPRPMLSVWTRSAVNAAGLSRK